MIYLRITRKEQKIRGNLCRLPSAVNVMLKLSNTETTQPDTKSPIVTILIVSIIANRGKWLKVKKANKQAEIYVKRPLTLHAHVLFYAHRLCMNYIISMLVLVSSTRTRNHLLYFARFVQGQPPK